MTELEGAFVGEEGAKSIEEVPRKKRTLLILILSTLIIIILIIIIFFIIFGNKPDNENNENLSPLIIFPVSGNHTQTFIFIPGLANTPENFENFMKYSITIPERNNTKIIILRSPFVKTSYDGKKNYSWFDIYNIPINSSDSYNFEDVKKSVKIIQNKIDEEVKILNGSYDKIILGGHSQGACLSLYTAYTANYNLKAVVGCNGILFPQIEIADNKENLNVFIAHGGNDPIIPIDFRNKTMERIFNYSGVRSYYYPEEGHAISKKEKSDISSFLKEVFEK